MQPIEIPVNKIRLFRLAFLYFLALLVGASIVYYLYRIERISYGLIFLMIIGIPLLFYILYLNLMVLYSKVAAFIINDNGILDNVSSIKVGVINWNNIAGVRLTRYMFSDFMLVDLHSNQRELEKLSRRQRNAAEFNIKKFNTPILVNLSSLSYDKEKLLKIIESYIIRDSK